MVFGAEVPVRLALEVFRRLGVERLQPVGRVHVAQPLFERHLILEEAENRLDVVDWRPDDRHVSEIFALVYERVKFL